MKRKILKVYNPNNLLTIPFQNLQDFQGDLKSRITKTELDKLKNSLKKHGLFVPKIVWFDEEDNANIIDGHQTKQALLSLEIDGWIIPEIPYVKVEAKDRNDAAEKLLQINSRYAKINPKSDWLRELGSITDMLSDAFIPDLDGLLNEEMYKDRQKRIKGAMGQESVSIVRILSSILETQGFIQEYVITTNQEIVGVPTNYKIDFGNPEKKIAIEVDGSYHTRKKQRGLDRKKDLCLEELGWIVLRINHK